MTSRIALPSSIRMPLLYVLLGVAISPSLGVMFGFHLEDLQTLLFPLLLGALFFLSAEQGVRLPTPVLVAASVLWLFGALNARNFIPALQASEGIAVTRLSEDPTGLRSRELKQRVVEISRLLGFAGAEEIPLSLKTEAEELAWLRNHPRVSFLIGGAAGFPRLVLPPSRKYLGAVATSSASQGLAEAPDLASVGLTLNDGIELIALPGIKTPLVFVSSPESISLTEEPKELVRHFLIWLSMGFSENAYLKRFIPATAATELTRSESESRAVWLRAWSLALRKHFFQVASDLYGAWPSSAPRTLALLQRGSMYVADGLATDGTVDEASLSCALGFYRRAQRTVHKEYAQQLYAAILNNTAVACLVQQTREPVCSMAFRGLIEATSQRRANGEMTRGARAAYLNLLLVKREGLF